MAEHLLEVTDLVTTYPGRGLRRRGEVRAVDGVSLSVDAGEILAIVGESGCGKTSTVQTIMRMVDPTSGSIVLQGTDITRMPERTLRPLRRTIQMVYQDPYESLDPRFTVRDTMNEPLLVHERQLSLQDREARIVAALDTVGLIPADGYLGRYPHELSGGQRQRVAIAAALVSDPSLLIADEPVSMLDVSVRAGILELLGSLCERGLGIIMITHDLATAAHFADRIAVMYLGRIVEEGPVDEVVRAPRHPYTRALLSVVPKPDPRQRQEPEILQGEAPDGSDVPPGCRFHPRCPIAVDACLTTDPLLAPVVGGEHTVACLRAATTDDRCADAEDTTDSGTRRAPASTTDVAAPAAHAEKNKGRDETA